MQEIGAAEAIIYKVQTLTDGGLRVTLDLSSQDVELVKKLLTRYAIGETLVNVGFASE